MKEMPKSIGGLILVAVVFFSLIMGLSWMVGTIIDDAAKELDNNGGLKVVAERVWHGKEAE